MILNKQWQCRHMKNNAKARPALCKEGATDSKGKVQFLSWGMQRTVLWHFVFVSMISSTCQTRGDVHVYEMLAIG